MAREEKIEKIMKAIQENGVSGCYGLRYENRELAIGDELGCSKAFDYNNGCQHEDEYLDGICATGFGYLWGDEDDADTVAEAVSVNDEYKNTGKYQYLVWGETYDHGDDASEVVISNAVVVAVL